MYNTSCFRKEKKLCQDVPTRWNSTYITLDGAFYYRRAFTHLKLSDSNYKNGIEKEEWDKIEGICRFLGVCYNVTRLFLGSKYPTPNLYFSNVFIVQHTLEKAILHPNSVARSMAIKMQPKFVKYWSDYNMILVIAVVFDPRYKTQFVEFCYKVLYGDNCYQITKLHETLKGLFELYQDKIPTYNVVFESESGSSIDNQALNKMKEFDALENDLSSSVEKIELDRYFKEKRLNRAIDIDMLDY
ncbi:zinc finger BED domain-containing protein RICESLEEPER 2-like [Apium graveolens]|uniref:zinc finger BED domain-containing protein RICESLEEPER 2-like n=1 Tax=Apium graveolens TaxID=4045 RepID=UPI003D7BAC76